MLRIVWYKFRYKSYLIYLKLTSLYRMARMRRNASKTSLTVIQTIFLFVSIHALAQVVYS